ncbi:MAG: response regulator [Myxococcales bacterium]|nr:response regulator [Myxococcales bacterium]
MIERESDGVERWVHGLGKLEFDDGGRPLRMIGTIRDITERKLLEQRIRHNEKMEAIGQLAGGVAHDFNNQLVGIMGYADLLRGQTTDRDVSRFVDKIILAARRAADLTAELLAFSRKGKYLSESVDLERIVVEVVNILRHTVDKRITIQKTFRASPATTLGDPSQLQNAILNLGLNARDAMPEGGVLHFETEIIELGAGPESSHSFQVLPGPYVRVTVRDTGVGMSRELQERVFEPFFTTKEKGRGTGMGLAAVYGTVKNHRGAIDVVSEPGRGTTIAIDLPLHFEREPPNATHDTPPRSERALRQALVVDDEEEVRHVLKAMLEGQGFAVLVSSNGAEGVELYRRRHEEIDIVILDMVMPVMGGRETYLEMKAINPNIHALLVSGYSLDGEAQSILDDGVRGFLQKPFRLEDLCAKLDELADPGPG